MTISGSYASGLYACVGIMLPEGITFDNFYIKNNIIVGFKYSSYCAPIAGGGVTINTNLKIEDNLFYDNGNSNNILFTTSPGGSNGIFVPGSGYSNVNNIRGQNPLFVSSGTNFHLQSTSSPAYHAGQYVGLTYDLDGNLWNNPPSMGCYEFYVEDEGGGGEEPPEPPDAPDGYYITTSGSDVTGDGSYENPWGSLYHACNNVTSGTIYMVDGTYYENRQCLLASGVNLVGIYNARIESTLSTSMYALLKLESWLGWQDTTKGNQVIDNIDFSGNLTTYAAIQVNFRHYVEIKNCNFYNFGTRGVIFYGQEGSTWTGTHPYYSERSMPNYWCKGNQIHDCYFENCGRNIGTTPYNGYGNINIGQQDGMLIYNVTIVQNQREDGYNGYGIKFYDEGWNKNTTIRNCDITCGQRVSGGWNFSLEMWYDLGGCQYYENRLRGQIDLTGSYLSEGFEYTSWFRDNIIGWDEPTDNTDAGLTIEACIQNVIISNNVIKNVSTGIMIQQIFPNSEWPIINEIENIEIYNNVLYNIGIAEGGWTYGGVSGISFTERHSGNKGKNCYIYNNTIVGLNYVRDDTYMMAGINYYCLTDWNNLQIRNNIIKGFKEASTYNAPILGRGESEMDSLHITNNIFYDCGNSNEPSFIESFDTGTNYINENNISSVPGFVNESENNYRLLEGSSAIGAGVDVGLTYDLDGNLWNNPPSMGCYERI
jgi:hypothetical protein